MVTQVHKAAESSRFYQAEKVPCAELIIIHFGFVNAFWMLQKSRLGSVVLFHVYTVFLYTELYGSFEIWVHFASARINEFYS